MAKQNIYLLVMAAILDLEMSDIYEHFILRTSFYLHFNFHRNRSKQKVLTFYQYN